MIRQVCNSLHKSCICANKNLLWITDLKNVPDLSWKKINYINFGYILIFSAFELEENVLYAYNKVN